MPGPKMGPRPPDFDEELVRRSPTFRKWEGLLPGGKLRYACREFVKGNGDDEERLMRRIMIARRNNVRDHQALKWARRMQSSVQQQQLVVNKEQTQQPEATAKTAAMAPLTEHEPSKQDGDPKGTCDPIKVQADKGVVVHNYNSGNYNNSIIGSRSETEAIISRTSHLLPSGQEPPPGRRSRRPTTLISDEAIKEEMDVPAVESTRSYKTWLALPNGAEFLYNQKYIKGHEAHDWLLKKNIWRRMRYRRENKKMVEEMLSRERGQAPSTMAQSSRKRRHEESATAIGSTLAGSTAHATSTMGSISINRIPAVGNLDGIMANASAPTTGMAVNVNTATATSAVAPPSTLVAVATPHDTNRQEVVASTASEIVDHALLSTNTGVVVPAPPIVHATTGDAMAIAIGEPPRNQPGQAAQAQALHHHHHHHHGVAESAAAFAASIALAGVGIGTDGDLNAHHDTAVADSAAVEAAVAAALAATDAKSDAYHQHHLSHHPHTHHAAGLMDVNHVVHGNNNDLAQASPGGLPHPSGESSAPTSTSNTGQAEGGAVDLGLALDAAAKLAAAASSSATCASVEAVLAATKVAAAVTKSNSGTATDPGIHQVKGEDDAPLGNNQDSLTF